MSTSTPDVGDVPTYGLCVIGYRAWRADAHGRLWPISDSRRPWVPGIHTARCNCDDDHEHLRLEWSTFDGKPRLEPAPSHRAPHAGCECGLYAWRHPLAAWDDPARATPPRVVGAVACWGLLQVHGDGFRAEHACIVTLAHHDDVEPGALATLRTIARRYRVDLVRLADLEEAARQHGSPLPDEVRPSPAATETVDGDRRDPPARRGDVPRPGPDATPDDVPATAPGRRTRLPLLVMGAVALAVVLAIVLLKVTGHPPRNCTWRQTALGKGAYAAECVPTVPRSTSP